MSTIDLDCRRRPWAERCMQEAVELGASFDLNNLKDLLRQNLGIPPTHHIVMTTSHEEALSTAVAGVAEGCTDALWDVAAPAAMRGAVKALQYRGLTCSESGWEESKNADLVAIQWWNEETLHKHPEKATTTHRQIVDLGAALALGHLPEWSRPDTIWTIPGWTLCGPVPSAWIVIPSRMKFTPMIHGTGQDPVRGGPIDQLLLWRAAGGILHYSQAKATFASRSSAVQEIVRQLQSTGGECVSKANGPAAVIHWPGISAIGIARACEARGLNLAVADACQGVKTDGSVGWSALGRPDIALEAVLITIDDILPSDMIDLAAHTINAAVKELQQLTS